MLCSLVLGALLATATAFAGSPDPQPTPARVVHPGGLDPTFGAAGTALAPPGQLVVWQAVAIQPDGKIVVAGNIDFGVDVVVARYESTGTLDPSFGGGGVVTTVFPDGGRMTAMTLTSGGDIVVVGSTIAEIAVLRLHADGTLDTQFAGGLVTIDIGANGYATAVIAQGESRIVVLAATNGPAQAAPSGSVVLVGLRNDGTIDPTFGQGGFARITGTAQDSFSADAMVQESNGRILVAATSSTDVSRSERLHIVRFDRNGHALRTFDTIEGFAVGLGLQSDGKVVVDGAYSDEQRSAFPALLRFDDDGALDDGFGDHGVHSSSESRPGRIVVDDQDRILIAADVLSRHYADGLLDTTFGVEGFAAGSSSAAFQSIAVQSDGKIVAAGGACFSNPKAGSGCITSLARYESDRTQLCGDADANGTYSVSDGVATLRAAADLDSICTLAVCDVDGSGIVGVTDGVNVLRAAAELPAALSCGIP